MKKLIAATLCCFVLSDLKSNTAEVSLQFHQHAPIAKTSISPENQFLYTKMDGEQMIVVWQLETGKKLKTIPVNQITNFQAGPGLYELTLIHNNNELRIIDVRNFKVQYKTSITEFSQPELYLMKNQSIILASKSTPQILVLGGKPEKNYRKKLPAGFIPEMLVPNSQNNSLLLISGQSKQHVYIQEQDFRSDKSLQINTPELNSLTTEFPFHYELRSQKQVFRYRYDQKKKQFEKEFFLRGRFKHRFLVKSAGNNVVCGNNSGLLQILDHKGNLKNAFRFKKSQITDLEISADQNFLVAGTVSGQLSLIDLRTLNIVHNFSHQSLPIPVGATYSRSGKTLYVAYSNRSLVYYNFENGKSGKTMYQNKGLLETGFSGFLPETNDSIAVFRYYEKSTHGYALIEGNLNVKLNTVHVREISFQQNNNFQSGMVVIENKDFKISYYHNVLLPLADPGLNSDYANTGVSSVFTIENKNGKIDVKADENSGISAIAVSEQFQLISVALTNGLIRHFDAETGKLLYSSVILSDKMFVHYLPDGFYMSSRFMLPEINFVNGVCLLPDKIGLQTLNRPDLIAKEIRQLDPILKKSIEQATHRVSGNSSTLHLNENIQLNVTEKKIDENGQITLRVKTNSPDEKIEHLSVSVNGKEDILPYNTENNYVFQTALPDGSYQIQLFAIGEKGSYSVMTTINGRNNVTTKKDLYLITIGSGSFVQNSFNLNYAEKDATDLNALFSKSKSYSNIHQMHYTGSQVTNELPSKVRSFVKDAKVNDVLIFFFAGHGVLDANMNLYLSTYNIDFNSPQLNGIPFHDMQEALEECPSRKKIMLIDACHSGLIDKEMAMNTIRDQTENDENFRFRNSGSGISQDELMLLASREYLSGVSGNQGLHIIGAAMGSQFALEKSELKNGVFTYCILQGVGLKKSDKNKDGKISIREIQDYVEEHVPALTKGKQQPTSRSENLRNNFILN